MLTTVLQVALGGAIGASGRYLLGLAVGHNIHNSPIPLGVLAANIIGSFLMGALVVFLGQKGLTHWNAFLATGVLGGFTTFSSFSLESWRLIDTGRYELAITYIMLSLVLSLIALMGGVVIMRGMLTA